MVAGLLFHMGLNVIVVGGGVSEDSHTPIFQMLCIKSGKHSLAQPQAVLISEKYWKSKENWFDSNPFHISKDVQWQLWACEKIYWTGSLAKMQSASRRVKKRMGEWEVNSNQPFEVKVPCLFPSTFPRCFPTLFLNKSSGVWFIVNCLNWGGKKERVYSIFNICGSFSVVEKWPSSSHQLWASPTLGQTG